MEKIKIIGNPSRPIRLKNLSHGEFGYISRKDVRISKPMSKMHKNCAINLDAYVYMGNSDENCIYVAMTQKGVLEIDLSSVYVYGFASEKVIENSNWYRIHVDINDVNMLIGDDLFDGEENDSSDEYFELLLDRFNAGEDLIPEELDALLNYVIDKEAYEIADKIKKTKNV